ncbi:hypothetical protein PCASD_00491 [Puccinia coronata f. sp. avenae]|uniref:Wax synthase domain-containing protein n=1 Tax=Puccinia coronata f. sp. avenae TaxID=200324 RepID=A0A2N5VNM4_9BASI|nr:hypothetical protein PCASD_00491 [Puccinia coronata f. sp. avenae]
MVAFLSSLTESQVFNFACVPLLLLQCSLLHPAYEADPSARVLRLLLLPVVVALAVSTQSRKLLLPLEEYLHVNYGLVAVPTFHICCLAAQFAFHRGPALKEEALVVESTEGDQAVAEVVQAEPEKLLHNASRSYAPQNVDITELRKRSRFGRQKQPTKLDYSLHGTKSPTIAELIKFSVGIVASPRGLAYTWAPPARCLSRAPRKPIVDFLRELLVDVVKKHTLFLMTCVYLLPAVNHPEGAAGWISEASGLRRSGVLEIIVNQLTAAIFTFSAICAFNLLGSVLTGTELLFITLARLILPDDLRPEPFDTTLYPPLFNRLISRENLSEFWGEGWQCVFRRDFVFCGGMPLAKLGCFFFGPGSVPLFTLMGSMLLSGIFHEWGILTITKPDWKFSTTKFFVIQGFGIVLERILNLRKVLGGRALRPLRYFITYFWLSYWSQDMFEALYERGLGRSGIIETDFRRWYWFQYLLPFGPFLPKGLMNLINIA